MAGILDPKGFTALVTGATSGIGEAVCRRFVGEGGRVIATGRRADRLEALKQKLGEACHTAVLDVRDAAAATALVKNLSAPFDRINVVVANAGQGVGMVLAQNADIGEWDDMVATNVNGLLHTVHAVLPGMVARDEGHVVIVGSIAGDYPYATGSVYGGSKAFAKQFALGLRADLLGKNIRVTNIEPGMTETEFMLVRHGGDQAKRDAVYQGIEPMTGDDIAETIFWSCSLPRHVNINRMQMMPVMQAFGPIVAHRK